MVTQLHPFTNPGAVPSSSSATALPRRATAAPAAASESPSALSLLRELINQLTILLRQEIALAGAELGRVLGSLKSGLTALAAAGAVIFCGFLLLLAAAVLGLATVLPGWLAALIVGVLVLALGGGLLLAARRQLHPAAVTPQRSSDSLKRDRDMVARHLS